MNSTTTPIHGAVRKQKSRILFLLLFFYVFAMFVHQFPRGRDRNCHVSELRHRASEQRAASSEQRHTRIFVVMLCSGLGTLLASGGKEEAQSRFAVESFLSRGRTNAFGTDAFSSRRSDVSWRSFLSFVRVFLLELYSFQGPKLSLMSPDAQTTMKTKLPRLAQWRLLHKKMKKK